MTEFSVPKSVIPHLLVWVVEVERQPEDDEGMQTLYGPFPNGDLALEFGEAEFGKGGWHIRSIWPVEIGD